MKNSEQINLTITSTDGKIIEEDKLVGLVIEIKEILNKRGLIGTMQWTKLEWENIDL